MATLILQAVGSLVGGPVGGAIGAIIGSQIDRALFTPSRTTLVEGPRLGDLTVQTSSYGQPIPLLFGAENRTSGNLIWSSGLVETKKTERQGGGKGRQWAENGSDDL